MEKKGGEAEELEAKSTELGPTESRSITQES